MTRPLAFRKVLPPSPEPLAFEQLVYNAEHLTASALLLTNFLEQQKETDGMGAAQLLADGLHRQATLLRQFMDTADDPR